MTTELIKNLRSNGEGCECEARASNECGCDVTWGSDYTSQAADTIERLERDLVAADIRIGNDKLEIAGLTREQVGLALDAARYQTLLEKALYALEYASDMTKPEGLSGCDCPICTVIGEIEAMKEAK